MSGSVGYSEAFAGVEKSEKEWEGVRGGVGRSAEEWEGARVVRGGGGVGVWDIERLARSGEE